MSAWLIVGAVVGSALMVVGCIVWAVFIMASGKIIPEFKFAYDPEREE